MQDEFGPVDCEIAAANLVECSYEGKLPPFESIEIEVIAKLIGEPPVRANLGANLGK